MRERGVLPPPQQVNPLQPRVGDQLPVREGRLPAPVPDNHGQLQVVHAGHFGLLPNGHRLVTGGIELIHEGWQVFADTAEIDDPNQLVIARGHVMLLGVDAVVRGDIVQFNFRSETFVAQDTTSDLRPSLIQGTLLDDLYVRGQKIYGTKREIFGENTWLTT